MQLAENIPVAALLLDLYRQPALWNAHDARTAAEGPFAGTDDIHIRFRDPAELVSREAYAEPFRCVWYPAWQALPHLRPIVFGLMARVEAVELGGVMITRVPPGEQVKPHTDKGRFHAEFYNIKVYVPLMTNPAVVSTCADEVVVMRAGDAWSFPNDLVHSTVNDGDCDRVTLIVCMRVE